MNDTTVCTHDISDVAMHRFESSYLVECGGCRAALGVMESPHAFQELRRMARSPRPGDHRKVDTPRST